MSTPQASKYSHIYHPGLRRHVPVCSSHGLTLLRFFVKSQVGGMDSDMYKTPPASILPKESVQGTPPTPLNTPGSSTEEEEDDTSNIPKQATIWEHYNNVTRIVPHTYATISRKFPGMIHYIESEDAILKKSQLGRGGYGKVFMGMKDGQVVKKVRLNQKRTSKKNVHSLISHKQGFENVKTEMKLYQLASQLGIGPKTYGFYFSRIAGYIVMEKYDVDLLRFCIHNPESIALLEPKLEKLFRSSIDLGILALDMKPHNILVRVNQKSGELDLVLTDFDPQFTTIMNLNDDKIRTTFSILVTSFFEYPVFEECLCSLYILSIAGFLLAQPRQKKRVIFQSFIANMQIVDFEPFLSKACVSFASDNAHSTCKIFQSMEWYMVHIILKTLKRSLYLRKYAQHPEKGTYPKVKFVDKIQDVQQCIQQKQHILTSKSMTTSKKRGATPTEGNISNKRKRT